jgi:hypothetical protein
VASIRSGRIALQDHARTPLGYIARMTRAARNPGEVADFATADDAVMP